MWELKLKLQKANAGIKFQNLEVGIAFINRTSKAKSIQEQINTFNFNKLKTYCPKDTINKTKNQATDRQMFVNVSVKDFH